MSFRNHRAKLKKESTCSSGKIQHADGLTAFNHLSWLRFAGYRASTYVCPKCDFIHVTTKNRK